MWSSIGFKQHAILSTERVSVIRVGRGFFCNPKFLTHSYLDGGLVGCFGFNGPLRQYFSLYRAVSQREGEKERKDR